MKTIFIDISDLLIYAVSNRRITGIQRVEISFLQFLIQNDIKYTLVNAFGVNPSQLDALIRDKISSPDELLRELAAQCFYLAPRKTSDKLKLLYKELSDKIIGRHHDNLAELHAGDTLFAPGAYWLNHKIMRFYRAAAAKDVKLVVLLHDVLPITHPHLMIENSDRFFGPILRLPIHVITGSNATKADLPRAAKLVRGARAPISVDVVYLAHEFPGVARNQPPHEQSQRLSGMIHGRPFVLYVSTVEVRKNHLRLIEVWNRLAKERGDTLPLLVIAGKKGWEADQTIGLLEAANARDKTNHAEPVLFVEGPSDVELQWLYASCDFTVFPSLAEGWGLPVGESLWFGKACAASHRTSIPEVGNDLCLYFDPEKLEEIEAAIKTLLDPKVRAGYESKIRAAALRTWQDTGRDLAKAVTAHVSGAPLQSAGTEAPFTLKSSIWQSSSFVP